MLIITTYHSPDIDGVACAMAYQELLKKQGKDVEATYFGDISREVEFVKNYTKYFTLKKHTGDYAEDTQFILVDTADPEAVEPTIKPTQVIEIFDHRELVFTGEFSNAKLNIEKVGSCATLITEIFQKNNLIPSRNVAIYLYSAIISNTVNFKNLVTTDRDKKSAEWLKPITQVEDDYVRKMFEYKSKIENKEDLIFLIEQDYAIKELGGKKFSIAQIEIAKLESVVDKYMDVIKKELQAMFSKEKLDYVLFTGIDIVEGFNILITIDKESDDFFSKVLEIPQINGRYKTKEIIMRKQIWPKIDNILK